MIGHGKPTSSLLSYAVIIVICYVVSLARHPYRPCASCDGTGRHRDATSDEEDWPCARCSGQGQRRRWGAQALYLQKRDKG